MKSIAFGGLAALIVIISAKADESAGPTGKTVETPKSGDQSTQSQQGSIAQQYQQIRAEYEVELAVLKATANRKSPSDERGVAGKRPRDLLVICCRRMVDLAELRPDDLAARDALLWVFNALGASPPTLARASALLVRHYGDDPEAIRIGLTLDNPSTAARDALVLGFYVAATGREAKGLAQLALAQYLTHKAKQVVYSRGTEGRPKARAVGAGKVIREFDLSNDQYAYLLSLRQCDPEAIRAEAARLYEEVISEYGDIPYITRRHRELETLLKEPAPQRNGKLLTQKDRERIQTTLARKRTLGQEAEARLDELLNLAINKPAPEIEGVDVDGKPLKLSDYKGKVVMLVFWGTWCGPCMAQVPHERELVARFKGQPFAVLGVNCKDDKERARKVMARERMTWPSWFDGAEDVGPISARYHVRSFPTVFILDAKGIIRSPQGGLEQTVAKLLGKMKQPTAIEKPSR